MTGSSRWLSTAVSPCPGKCLAEVSRPPLEAPRMNAAPSWATISGSSPNERMLITGLSGLLLTSTTGANAQWMPSARPSRAVTSPRKRAASSERVAPTAIAKGRSTVPLRTRKARLRSISIATSSGIRASVWSWLSRRGMVASSERIKTSPPTPWSRMASTSSRAVSDCGFRG